MLKVLEQTISNEYMTTNNNNRIPELRFPGFTGEWVVKKLGEVCDIVMGQSPSSDKYNTIGDGLPLIQGNSDIKDRKSIIRLYTSQITKICQANDILMSVRAPVGYISRATTKSCIGRGVCAIKNGTDYIYQYLLSIEPSWETLAAGSTFTCVNSDDIEKHSILLPPTLAEQQKIAECLSSLDEEIAAEAQKADALKDHKKGLMQQLFPAMSNKQLAMSNCVPKLRFSGFTGEWVVKKFDELFSLLSNNTCSRADLNESNGIAVNIHYGDVLIKYNEILNIQDTKIPFITESKLVSKYKDSILRDGDIIIADTAEDSTVGKCTEIQNRQQTIILSGLHTIPARPLRKFAKGFLGYIMNSESYHDQLLPLMQGAKVSSISRTAIKKTFICFPTLAEQQKIADCLSELDEMISAQQQKVEALKEHKKGLMQKLFPKMSNTK